MLILYSYVGVLTSKYHSCRHQSYSYDMETGKYLKVIKCLFNGHSKKYSAILAMLCCDHSILLLFLPAFIRLNHIRLAFLVWIRSSFCISVNMIRIWMPKKLATWVIMLDMNIIYISIICILDCFMMISHFPWNYNNRKTRKNSNVLSVKQKIRINSTYKIYVSIQKYASPFA